MKDNRVTQHQIEPIGCHDSKNIRHYFDFSDLVNQPNSHLMALHSQPIIGACVCHRGLTQKEQKRRQHASQLTVPVKRGGLPHKVHLEVVRHLHRSPRTAPQLDGNLISIVSYRKSRRTQQTKFNSSHSCITRPIAPLTRPPHCLPIS